MLDVENVNVNWPFKLWSSPKRVMRSILVVIKHTGAPLFKVQCNILLNAMDEEDYADEFQKIILKFIDINNESKVFGKGEIPMYSDMQQQIECRK